MTIRIRNSKFGDLAVVAKIYTDNWKETYHDMLPKDFLDSMNYENSEEKWHNFLTNQENDLFLAIADNHIAGFVATSKDTEVPNAVYIDSLHISKEFRNKGIGSKLLSYTLNSIKKKQQTATICIMVGNDSARSVYTKLGAVHYKYFEDTFGDTVTQSEKLIWKNIT